MKSKGGGSCKRNRLTRNGVGSRRNHPGVVVQFGGKNLEKHPRERRTASTRKRIPKRREKRRGRTIGRHLL